MGNSGWDGAGARGRGGGNEKSGVLGPVEGPSACVTGERLVTERLGRF